MSTALTDLAELVHGASGIRLVDAQHDALEAAVARVEPATDAAGFLRQAAHPVAGARLVARLLDELTVKETYFLRDRAQLEGIDWHRLLRAARAAGSPTIRVWSAACATGEEAYTLALLASEAFGGHEPPVTILATDISGAALARARAGEYRPRAVRELEPALRRRYFAEHENSFVVGDRLRACVTFARHNLSLDPIPPLGVAQFDLVLCRNVLIYFDPGTVERVVSSLERAVSRSGMLVLGAADVLCVTVRRLGRVPETAAAEPVPGKRRRPLGRRAGDVGDPLDAEAAFLRGLAELEQGDVQGAIVSLRRVLYADPRLGIAAFQLGRAYEALGDLVAARRAYEQALRTLHVTGELQDQLLEQVDLADVESAVRTRLDALESVGVGRAAA